MKRTEIKDYKDNISSIKSLPYKESGSSWTFDL